MLPTIIKWKIFILLGIVGAVVLPFYGYGASQATLTMEQRYQQVGQTNQALVQAYRWFAILNRTPISQNPIPADLFAPEVDVALEESNSPQNAIFSYSIENFDFTIKSDQDSKLKVQVLRQFSKQDQPELWEYVFQFRSSSTFLPQVQQIQKKPLRPANPVETLHNAYAENRARSAVYYWTVLLDQNTGEFQHFQEMLFQNQWTFHWVDGTLQSPEQLSQWITHRTNTIQKSSHIVDHLKIEPLDARTYKATFEYDWRGQNQSGETIVARTQQEWILVETGGRFPRIQSIRERYLLPLIDTGTRIRC